MAFVAPVFWADAISHQVDSDRALELHTHFVDWVDMEITARIGTVDDPLVKVERVGAGRIRHESSQEAVDG